MDGRLSAGVVVDLWLLIYRFVYVTTLTYRHENDFADTRGQNGLQLSGGRAQH